MRFGLEGAVRRRILAALLAGIMVFSQTGTAFAAENAAAADTAVEAAAEEEPEAEAAVVEEPEEPEGEKEPEVVPAEGAENEDTSADEIQDEVTTDDEEPGDTVVDESEETMKPSKSRKRKWLPKSPRRKMNTGALSWIQRMRLTEMISG